MVKGGALFTMKGGECLRNHESGAKLMLLASSRVFCAPPSDLSLSTTGMDLSPPSEVGMLH